MEEKTYSVRVIRNLIIIIVVLLLVLVGVITYYFTSDQKGAGDLVAIVNNVEIRETAFYNELKDRYGIMTLNEMIERLVIRDAAVKYKITANKLETNRVLGQFRSQFASEEEFISYLGSELGMTLEQFTRDVEHYILWEQLATKDIEVSEDAVNLYYQNNMDKYKVHESYHLQQIVVESEELAHELVTDIQAGANFNQLARTLSIDYMSISTGGDLGYVYADSMMVEPEIIRKARIMKEHELAIVAAGERYHVVQLLGAEEAYQYSYTEVKDQIARELALSYAEPLGVVMEQLKEELGVEIFDEPLKVR